MLLNPSTFLVNWFFLGTVKFAFQVLDVLNQVTPEYLNLKEIALFLVSPSALPDTSNPIIKPNKPNTELKISMTRTLTNLGDAVSALSGILQLLQWTYKLGSAASAKAALLPLMPTETPQTRLHVPTVIPAQNSAKPV